MSGYEITRGSVPVLWPASRSGRLWLRFRCLVEGHIWSPWLVNDITLRGTQAMWKRPAHHGEPGTRECQRGCGAIERRRPCSR